MILVDNAEPEDIVKLIQQSVPIEVTNLNQSLMSDYYFTGDSDRTIQFNRVQAGELLSNIDSMEDELRRYYDSAEDNNMIIEGILTDVPLTRKDKSMDTLNEGTRGWVGQTKKSVRGLKETYKEAKIYTYKIAANGFMFGEEIHNENISKLYAWIYRLQESGVSTYFTHNYVGTAKLLCAVYHNCQKSPEEHNTLNRYYIPRVYLSEKTPEKKRISIREQNPFIRSLMALSIINNIGIGEEKATALHRAGYKTLYDLAFATPKELMKVPGIGKILAEKLLTAIGVEL